MGLLYIYNQRSILRWYYSVIVKLRLCYFYLNTMGVKMKLESVWSIFIIALVSLLLLQGLWLYNAYTLKTQELQKMINVTFAEAIEKELDNRFLAISEGNIEFELEDTVAVGTFAFQRAYVDELGVMSQQFEFFQQLMLLQDQSFSLSTLDSIYSSLLIFKDISSPYQLIYRDTVTGTIQSAGVSDITNDFATQVIPIINGTEVLAVHYITLPDVLKQMVWISVVSISILLLILGCLLYELRVIFTQRKLTSLRDDFTNALTHDMKTPLGTIYMALDQWHKGSLDEKPELRTQFGQIAIEQVLSLQVLVDKILTIAYMEKGRLALDRKPIDLSAIMKELGNKFSVHKGNKSVSISYSLDLKDEEISADPVYLKNAISNLIDNAIKYSGDETIIEINAYTLHNRLYVKVKDNGLGISLKDQQTIFEKYERGAAVNRRGAKGFGLGLNYVKRVIEAHGGTVGVSSMENEGSEFVLVIPLQESLIK